MRDEDWDSDAEEAGAGQWVKGEWQPIVKKKERWWERAKRSRSKTDHATEKHEHNSNSTKSSGAEATQVIVPALPDRSQQIDVGVKMAEDASSSVISVDKGNSTGGGEGGGGYKSGFEVFAEGAIVVGDDLEILLKDVNDDELADGITPHHTQFLHTVILFILWDSMLEPSLSSLLGTEVNRYCRCCACCVLVHWSQRRKLMSRP